MNCFRTKFHAPLWAICGSIAFLTGCPGTDERAAKSVVATMVVEGIETGTAQAHQPGNIEELRQRVLELANQERTSRGLPAVSLNEQLCEISDAYARRMIEGGFFNHKDPETEEGPGNRAMNGNYLFLAIGENLAGGQSSPEQVMQEWLESDQGHRENILSAQWREMGIAVRTGGEYGVYWVQMFGNPP